MSNDNYTGRNLYRVEVDATKVNELLKRLNDKEAKKAISSALRKSILIIRKQAQENLVSAVTDAEFGSSKNGVSFKPLKDEINVAVYEQNIKNRIGELYKIRNEILQTVNQVESATLRRLLIKRYIQNLTWEKIAEQLNYSYKHVVHILHPKALSAIKRVLEKD